MAVSTASKIADFFIYIANNNGDTICNLKLQKLLYYAQAWFLALNEGKPIFDEPIEAWVLGPAVSKVYNSYKKFASDPIEKKLNEKDFYDFDPEIIDFLTDVYTKYGKFSALELVRLTHSEKPWIEARGNLDPTDRSKNIISNERMKQFYSSCL